MTLYLSWSQLRTHEECKQKGYLTRTKKTLAVRDQRNFFPGNVTDRTVRDWLMGPDPDADYTPEPGMMPQMVESIIEREIQIIEEGDPEKKVPPGQMHWRDKGDRDRVLKECIEAVTKIEPALLKHVVPFGYQADVNFKAPLQIPHPAGGRDTVFLIGYMDILVQDDQGRWFVFDVKHTRDRYYYKKTIQQLTFYDLAVQLMYGQPTTLTALFQPLVEGRPIHPHKVDPDARNQLAQRFINLAHDRWKDDRTPTRQSGCTVCEVKHGCVLFKPRRDANGKKRVPF